MIRYRFKTNSVSDPRPLVSMAPIKMPWWCTGFSCTTNKYAIIVCYLPEGEPLTKYWDDAFDIESETVNGISYSERFPKPEWCE